MTRQKDHRSLSGWHDCPPGEIGRLVTRLQRERRRETLTQAAVAGSVLTVVLIAGAFAVPRLFTPDEPIYGGLTCSEVRAHAEAYLAGTLDEATKRRIDHHLSRCAHCRQYLLKGQDRVDNTHVALGSGQVVAKPNDALATGTQPAGSASSRASANAQHCED